MVAVADLEVVGPHAVALAAAVDLLEGAEAGVGPHVQVARDGGRADVEPVTVVGRQLARDRRLDDVGPLGDLHLS